MSIGLLIGQVFSSSGDIYTKLVESSVETKLDNFINSWYKNSRFL